MNMCSFIAFKLKLLNYGSLPMLITAVDSANCDGNDDISFQNLPILSGVFYLLTPLGDRLS